eukprot:735887-Amphidinium_carterae.2
MGDYTGGELHLYDGARWQLLNGHLKFILFDATQEHEVRRYAGVRRSVTFFVTRFPHHLEKSHWTSLAKWGYPVDECVDACHTFISLFQPKNAPSDPCVDNEDETDSCLKSEVSCPPAVFPKVCAISDGGVVAEFPEVCARVEKVVPAEPEEVCATSKVGAIAEFPVVCAQESEIVHVEPEEVCATSKVGAIAEFPVVRAQESEIVHVKSGEVPAQDSVAVTDEISGVHARGKATQRRVAKRSTEKIGGSMKGPTKRKGRTSGLPASAGKKHSNFETRDDFTFVGDFEALLLPLFGREGGISRSPFRDFLLGGRQLLQGFLPHGGT